MSVFDGMADAFVDAFGRDGNYFAPGSDAGEPCRFIPTAAETDKPELSGKPATGGYRIAVHRGAVAAPVHGGRFVETGGATYTIVGKPTVDVENPDLWICKAA